MKRVSTYLKCDPKINVSVLAKFNFWQFYGSLIKSWLFTWFARGNPKMNIMMMRDEANKLFCQIEEFIEISYLTS